MLYVTTRNDQDVFTAQRALIENRGPDGGLFVPFREPHFSPEEIAALQGKSVNRCIADILNLLFNTRLTGYDVDFVIGRYAFRLKMLGKRVIMGECWHNLESDFSRIIKNLTQLVSGETEIPVQPGSWAEIAVRIGILFGLFGELMRQGILQQGNTIDIAVVSGDFSAPISAWYAKRWGLPVGNILCCCNENGNLWDFICHGQLKTGDVAVSTTTKEADIVVPSGLERLIYSYAGAQEVERYLDAIRQGRNYYIDDGLLLRLRQGLYVTVSSEQRILSAIPNVHSTYHYVLSAYSALIYSGLQDYRARTGEGRMALVFAEKSPSLDLDTVSNAMGITQDELRNYLK